MARGILMSGGAGGECAGKKERINSGYFQSQFPALTTSDLTKMRSLVKSSRIFGRW